MPPDPSTPQSTGTEPRATDLAGVTSRMLTLAGRLMNATAQAQQHAVRQATGSEFSLMDAETLGRAYGAFWASALHNPDAVLAAQMKVGESLLRAWSGIWSADSAPETKRRDRRFSDPSWEKDPLARGYRDAFLQLEDAANELLHELDDGSKEHMRVSFFTRQFISSLAPSNFLATSAPARRTLGSSMGESFLDGLENLLNDLERGKGRLDLSTTDRTAFTVGEDLATTEGAVIYQNELMQLIQYAPLTEKQHAVPMLIVPPWINKYYVLDLQPKNSLVRYLLEQGHTVFLISWVNPRKEHADLDFSAYMRLGPLTALDAVLEVADAPRANILGFCIGGILVTATLAYLAAKGDGRINTATTFATMIDFEDVGEIGVFIDENRLAILREHMREKGYLESHHLQDMFSMLREKDLIWSFYEANYLRGSKPRAFDLLYWNADSTRLPAAMLLWYLDQIYLQNRLRQPGGLTMDGVPIDVTRIETPCYVLATEEDHIAPWRSVYPTTQILGGEVEFVLGGSGHIAGVINPPSERKKYRYRTADAYPADPDEFLEQAEEVAGSWWPHWVAWLAARDERQVAARKIAGRGKYRAIEPAPGSYVLGQ